MDKQEEQNIMDDELSYEEPIMPENLLKLELEVLRNNDEDDHIASSNNCVGYVDCVISEGELNPATSEEEINCSDFSQFQNFGHSCKGCDKTYASLFHLERHLKTCMAKRSTGKLDPDNIPADIDSLAETTEGKKTYRCNICDYRTTFRDRVKRHLFTHTEERPYTCDVCGRGFVEANFLITHQRIHTGDKLFKCSECSYTCNAVSSLKRHTTCHTGERKFACSHCHFKTAEKAKLEIHLRVHSGDKPYSCKMCSFKTAYNAHLINHMKIHTGERPYSCPLCSYSAIQERHLIEHMTIHSGEKPYPCPHCQYRSKQKGTLTRHIARQHSAETAIDT